MSAPNTLRPPESFDDAVLLTHVLTDERLHKQLTAAFPTDRVEAVAFETRGLIGATLAEAQPRITAMMPQVPEELRERVDLIRTIGEREAARIATDDPDSTGFQLPLFDRPTADGKPLLTREEEILVEPAPFPVVEASDVHFDALDSRIVLRAVRKATRREEYRSAALDFLARNAPTAAERERRALQLQKDIRISRARRRRVFLGQAMLAVVAGLVRR